MRSYIESDDDEEVVRPVRPAGRAAKRIKTVAASSDEDEFQQDNVAENYSDDGWYPNETHHQPENVD